MLNLDKNSSFVIFFKSSKIFKNEEIIFTEGNSKAESKKNIITASNFKFDRSENILTADKNVKYLDKNEEFTIYSDKTTYKKNEEIIFTEGNSKAESKKNIKQHQISNLIEVKIF